MTPEQREELKAAAQSADQDGQHIYTNPRDSNNWRNNDSFNAAASPAVVLSLIAQVEALTVPQGWKLVPIEATRDMVLAGAKHTTPAEDDDTDSQQCYFIGLGRAACAYVEMIDAAPTIPAIPGTKEGA